jgi:hypothetical protein
MLMVELFPVNVKFVGAVPKSKNSDSVSVLVDKFTVLVADPADAKLCAVKLYPPVKKAPSVTINLEHVRAPVSVVVLAPVVLSVMMVLASETPFVLIVEFDVGAKVIDLDDVTVRLVAGKDILPAIVQVPVPLLASVMAPSSPLTVMLRQFIDPLIVTVNDPVPTFELTLKNTSSDVVGTDAPDEPPDEVDQLVVLEELQVPVPPTQ